VRPGFRGIALFVAFGGELTHAAFRVRAGSFSLAGIHLEEILGVGLQVLQMDAVILRFCLLIVRVSGFGGLAQLIGAGSIMDDAAASGISRPGDDRPGWSSALDARPVSDFYRLRFRCVLGRRRGGSSQSRC
jgi:hypothetical protein